MGSWLDRVLPANTKVRVSNPNMPSGYSTYDQVAVPTGQISPTAQGNSRVGSKLTWLADTAAEIGYIPLVKESTTSGNCPECGSVNYTRLDRVKKLGPSGMAEAAPRCFDCNYTPGSGVVKDASEQGMISAEIVGGGQTARQGVNGKPFTLRDGKSVTGSDWSFNN